MIRIKLRDCSVASVSVHMTHVLGLGAKRGVGLRFSCFDVVDELGGVGVGEFSGEGLALAFLFDHLLLQLDCALR